MCCSYSQFTRLHFASKKEHIHNAHKAPIYIDCMSGFQVACAPHEAISASERKNLHVSKINETFVHVCVFKQYFAQCRDSIPYAGADRSSGLWEERAGPQTVPGIQRILCIWVSFNVSHSSQASMLVSKTFHAQCSLWFFISE